MSDITIKPGDVYCPRCLGNKVEYQLTRRLISWYCPKFTCEDFEHPFEVNEDGRFDWVWSDDFPPPNPGCPWCKSRNIRTMFSGFQCLRQGCMRKWDGWFTRRNNDWKTDRWTIKVPVRDVPWRSGTFADLECARRSESGFIDCDPACCRWPKSCRAFDAGYKTGFGPTVLPVIWNDGYSWRSGPPDITAIPKHLVDQIVTRWRLATGDTSE